MSKFSSDCNTSQSFFKSLYSLAKAEAIMTVVLITAYPHDGHANKKHYRQDRRDNLYDRYWLLARPHATDHF